MTNPLGKLVRAYSTMYKINKFQIEQMRNEHEALKPKREEEKARKKAEIDAQIQKYKLEREHQFQLDQLKKDEEKKKKEAKRFSPWDF